MKWLALLLLALLLASCDTVWDEPFTVDSELPDAEGFYATISGIYQLKYKVVAGNLECKLTAPVSGWIAVGFAPTIQMKDANFIIAYVSGGVGYISDEYGDSNSSHVPDISIGGTSDVTLLGATEEGGITNLHFQIPLNSGDSKDRILQVGNSYPVIFANSDEDDFESYHAGYGMGSIRIR